MDNKWTISCKDGVLVRKEKGSGEKLGRSTVMDRAKVGFHATIVGSQQLSSFVKRKIRIGHVE